MPTAPITRDSVSGKLDSGKQHETKPNIIAVITSTMFLYIEGGTHCPPGFNKATKEIFMH